jgi:excisionase family DNA binding protein
MMFDVANSGRPTTDAGVDEERSLLTVPDVAKLLRIPRATIYELVRRNAIPHARIGKHIRFRKKEILRDLFACGQSQVAGKEGQQCL